MFLKPIGLTAALLSAVAAGWVAANVLQSRDVPPSIKPLSASANEHDAHHEGSEHLDLSEPAQKSLGLKLAALEPSTFTRSLLLPAAVIENPGHSGRTVSSRVQGIVEAVHVSMGEHVKPGQPLFDIRLTGDAIVTAQSSLLEAIIQVDTTKRELDRITELAQQGTLPGKTKTQLEYELRKLDAQRHLRQQELFVRGLSVEQIANVIKSNTLIGDLRITVPARQSSPDNTSPDAARHGQADSFTVETIDVHPGKTINPGDQLAHLAWHDQLYVEGYAFERDLAAIATIISNRVPVQLEFGSHDAPVVLEDMRIRYIDNHVDKDSGAFRFYVEFNNQLLQDATDDEHRIYRSWRFKPGQRLHVRLPVEQIEQQFVLPLAAVVQEGVNAYVFRVEAHDHSEDTHAGHNHAGHSHAHDTLALEQVPVSIVTQDTKQVVIATGGLLKTGDKVAMNSAYQLRLALKADSGSGHGHSHEH